MFVEQDSTGVERLRSKHVPLEPQARATTHSKRTADDINRAQREFDAKVAAATAQHDAAVIEAATRKDKHFKRYDDSALAETDDRIAQAQKQLEEAERVASILPVRPVEHYCSITADGWSPPA